MKLGSVLVLLFAVAPQVLYLGHPLSEDAGCNRRAIRPPGHEEHAKAAAEHADHCHVGPKGCAASDGVVHVASFDTLIEISNDNGATSAVEITPLPRTSHCGSVRRSLLSRCSPAAQPISYIH